MPKVSALNEAITGSVKSVFRSWEQRLNSSEVGFVCVRSKLLCYLLFNLLLQLSGDRIALTHPLLFDIVYQSI